MCEPSVLIGIVTHNRAGILPRSINSALSQTGIDSTVSLIDDGSSDQTSNLEQCFPAIKWIRWSQSRGYMEARNYLMRNAVADYFVGLDDDAWFLKDDEVAEAALLMEKDQRIGAIAFDILSPDKPAVSERSGSIIVPSFIGCGHMVRLKAVREVGFYEPTPCAYAGEEKDLCLRLLDTGYKVVKLIGVHVWHDKTPTARDLIAQYESGVCNDFLMTYRRTPALFLPAALAMKVAQHARGAWSRGLTRPAWRGFRRFIASFPRERKTRRPVKTATLRTFMKLARA